MTGARNVRGGLVLMSLGLAAGLGMSLYAFTPMVPVPEALARYDDLPRRLLRLAHVAAIMLPLINVLLGPWLDRLDLPEALRQAASWLLLLGAAGLPLALAGEALVPAIRPLHLTGLPALVFCLAVFLIAAGACRSPLTMEVSHARHHGPRIEGEGRHRRAPAPGAPGDAHRRHPAP